MNEPHPIEHESLPAHVTACAERYKTLFNRLNRIERIQLVVAGKVFLILLAVIGFLVTRILGLAA